MRFRSLRFPLLRGLCGLLALAAAGSLSAQPAPAPAPVAAPAATPAAARPAANQPPANAAAPAPTSADSPPPRFLVQTIRGDQFASDRVELQSAMLVLEGDPPRDVPLDEMDSVRFGGALGASAEWLGQDGRDYAQIGNVAQGNGIQDIHVRLRGIPPGKKISQIQIVVGPPWTGWRMNVANSVHSRIVVKREPRSRVVDLYFEPPAADARGKSFEIQLTYSDKTQDSLNVTAETRTDATLAVGQQPEEVPALAEFVIDLEGGDRIHGQLAAMTDETLTLRTAWHEALPVPLLHVRGFIHSAALPEHTSRYQQALAAPPIEDLALIQARDGGLAELAGRAGSFAEGQLQLEYEGETRSVNVDRLLGLVFAAHPPVRDRLAMHQVVQLASGETISGTWQAQDGETFYFQTLWGAPIHFLRDDIDRISGRNGKLVRLSEMDPASVEETPYFGRVLPLQKDASWNGRPLRLGQTEYEKGFAVHSRNVLTFDIGRQFSTFKTSVGFDETADPRGCVDLRILADGRELFTRRDFQPADGPQEIEVSVAGASQLVLEVDFGKFEDIGDRIVWGDPRLYREER